MLTLDDRAISLLIDFKIFAFDFTSELSIFSLANLLFASLSFILLKREVNQNPLYFLLYKLILEYFPILIFAIITFSDFAKLPKRFGGSVAKPLLYAPVRSEVTNFFLVIFNPSSD
jgi:hypothetical protein